MTIEQLMRHWFESNGEGCDGEAWGVVDLA